MRINFRFMIIFVLLLPFVSACFAIPYWYNFSIERVAENQVKVYAFWNESNASCNLSSFIVSWNYSNSIYNDSIILFNTTPGWSNSTKVIDSTTKIRAMVYVNNTLNEWNSTNWSDQLLIDILNPEVLITEPMNNTIIGKDWVILNYTTIDNYKTNLSCWYGLNDEIVYDSIVNNGSFRIINITNLSEGMYKLWVICQDDILNGTSNLINFKVDLNTPFYSNITQIPNRNPYYNEDVFCNVVWNDSINLTEVIFSSNYSGVWTNYTITLDASEPYSVSYKIGAGNWTIGKVYAWKYYAKDSLQHWNEIPTLIYVVNDLPQQPYQPTQAQLTLYFPTRIILTQASFYDTNAIVSAHNGNISNVYLSISGLNNSWYQINPIYKNITMNTNETFQIRFVIPLDAIIGDYPFSVTANGVSANNPVSSNKINTTMIVNRAVPFLNISVDLKNNVVWVGSLLNFIVNITNFGKGATNVFLEYQIKKGEKVFEKTNETVFVEDFLSLDRAILIPMQIDPGVYEVIVLASYMYEQKINASASLFVKKDCVKISKTNFLISSNKSNEIKIILENVCGLPIHHLNVRIESLNYSKNFSILDKNLEIILNLNLEEGMYDYLLYIDYDEGGSIIPLKFNSRSPFYMERIDTIKDKIKNLREEIDQLHLFPKSNLYSSLLNIEFLLNKSLMYIELGDYVSADKIILAIIDYINKLSDEIKLKRSFEWIGILVIFILILSSLLFVFGIEKKFIEKTKFIAQPKKIEVDFSKIPKKGIYLGKILNTKENAYIDVNELMKHMLLAGSTGSGKSVTAMIIAEELLKLKIPVIVLDPTQQWTGFISKCDEQSMLRLYKEFGLKEPMNFATDIIRIDADTKIEMERYWQGGITVFCLNELNNEDFDEFIKKFLNSFFEADLEESEKLKLLIVLEEVHRLLPKYGGKKAYLMLEKAVREFRKWGIGLLLTSQVLTDFKAVIRANVETEIQFRTNYEGDINRIKEKYGGAFAKMIPKLKTGVGMIQNPEYNNANPYFIKFRPLLHSPHSIPNKKIDEIQIYRKKILELKEKIDELKDRRDVSEMKISLELAAEKLRHGMLELVKYYLEDIENKIKIK
ncbi:MAG: DUF87 domain-containing protein [Candidatus Parvarchaeota archaeon]|nr:DUF87 domain-containing protein [Candidatus Jingweiarchaeum tengchongense]MCW1298050.1 DUF87 domain-containing protein [Candidatus Jingweiarchaeum tengchongense]MCW1300150.1 DUF87 domain-containing protein [Candidatus Jingweiarchaeum tengchongense]MCW1310912.1 DUF87 domain-containing protein [Candidatus Jingweiarchaeum tengchongense]